jgi:ADP-heptose:LPS heptosyltransferase
MTINTVDAPQKILVIKLSALGDFILSLGAMEAIRRHHPSAHITLLTTKPFYDMATRSRYFNDVWVDERPPLFAVHKWIAFYRRLRRAGFERVYDLQMSGRTNAYFKLFHPKPEWSGTARGVSHPFDDPARSGRHVFDNHKIRLAAFGIDVSYPDLTWMKTDVSSFGLKSPYILMVPGCAPQHPHKRWPAQKYAALAIKLSRAGYDIALLGTAAEAEAIAVIHRICPAAKDLSGRTSFYDIATLAHGAAGAVGNDTGPVHLIAHAGGSVVALFSGAGDPKLSQPVGRDVQVIQADDIADIPVDVVFSSIEKQAAA